MVDAIDIFDRRRHRENRARAARNFAEHDFLFREVGERLFDRLQDVNRRFSRALVVGCRAPLPPGLVDETVGMDLTPPFATHVVADEEALPFAPASFDLILSPLALHWVNDLPGALIQLRRALKPDGLLLAALFGGGTLYELRHALLEAEMEIEAGASPRVSPFAEIRDAGGLLQRAGLALPVADMDTITVTYDNPLKLLADLRGMGEQNVIRERRRSFLRRATLLRAMEIYAERHADADGRVPATFEVVFLTGWAPHESQQQPLRPGSAAQRLADALDANEIGAGEKIRPPRKGSS
ncbi:MAG: methyltransferase domain-containing protein [Minwuia sp.]|uniref:methyltransferase domain-containing protein n=1 Tax=Minwuia sp. TaxID=2493630 RepID=UPI003A87B95A